MDIRVLRYFLVICQEKNITRAAQRLHLSQPSLSKQIKDLEDELGVTLFMRGHRKITLTEEGYFLRDRAKEIVNLTDDTANSLEKTKIISGTLRIGLGESPAIYPIMQLLNRLILNYPEIKIELVDDIADTVERRLNQGTLDFGIVMGDRLLDDFDSIILKPKNEFVAVFDGKLPLAQKALIKPQDLVDYPLIITSQTHVEGKFKDWFGKYYPKINIVANSNLSYNGSLLAQAGHLVHITYRDIADIDRTNLVQRPLSPNVWDKNTLIWKKDIKQSNLERLFLNEIKKLS
ncbi:DNA-binding transcriptional LysR family regulator [Lactobacillus colini]|uniref:DNA-binding transcriptional LysR family regulator n=1 Tax=Lactobacillus colini TaxID=1819254 RepID=A0ABS4MGG1_9LACO|nr:LysR family transcriptional regulator [Lactobacillus colini]MBP2058784.1 DNA-binding transcriptional LysR family regulator [Lactobacillus colini]